MVFVSLSRLILSPKGGGGTFGVVLESTILASPRVTLQTVIMAFSPNTTRTTELWNILADNGLKWANEGWGGFSTSGIAILINPKISAEQAAISMDPLVQFGKRLQSEGVIGTQTIVTEFPSWGAFFKTFTQDHVAVRSFRHLCLASQSTFIGRWFQSCTRITSNQQR